MRRGSSAKENSGGGGDVRECGVWGAAFLPMGGQISAEVREDKVQLVTSEGDRPLCCNLLYLLSLPC